MIVLGFVLILIGIVYFYKPTWIIKLCQLVKSYVFNERVVILYGKKIGLVFIMSGVIFIGVNVRNEIGRNDLYKAYKNYHTKKFETAEKICMSILKDQPNNTDALMLLGKIYFVTERYLLAKSTLLKIKDLPQTKKKEVEKYLNLIDMKLKRDVKNENKF